MHFFVALLIRRDIIIYVSSLPMEVHIFFYYCCNALEEFQMHSPDKFFFHCFDVDLVKGNENILEFLQLQFLYLFNSFFYLF